MKDDYTYNTILDDDVGIYKKTIIEAKVVNSVNKFVDNLLIKYPSLIDESNYYKSCSFYASSLYIHCTLERDDGNISGSTSVFCPSYIFQVEIGDSVESLKRRLTELIKSNIDIVFKDYLNRGYSIKLSL